MKIDHKKELKHLYAASAKAPVLVDVPDMNFLMIDGTGNPNNSESYVQAVEALYTTSYAAKFHVKKDLQGDDYSVMPLEGLWWTDNPADFSVDNKAAWKWTMMQMQPDLVTPEVIAVARERAEKKLGRDTSAVRFAAFHEGRAAQILHVGPYSEELPTIQALHEFVANNGLKLRDKHREIYLSDPRRSAPEKLKTILRHPVEAA